MNRELISRKTRLEFREFLVGWTLGEIGDEFEAVGISADRSYQPTVGGQRRGYVEQFYRSLDLTNPVDAKKLIKAYENILNTILEKAGGGFLPGGVDHRAQTMNVVDRLASWLKRDGYIYDYPSGRILPASGTHQLEDARTVAFELNADYVTDQVERMRGAVESSPDVAIGTAKEFVETICKTILQDRGVDYGKGDDFPKIVRQALKELKLAPDDIPEQAKAAGTIRGILQNLAAVSNGLAELRNPFGTGHGKPAHTKGLRERHARLAVGAATTLGVFLFDTYREGKSKT